MRMDAVAKFLPVRTFYYGKRRTCHSIHGSMMMKKPLLFVPCGGCLLCLLLLLPVLHARAEQPPLVSETQVKAVYLYNFARFTTWPDHAFEGSQFSLCILGEDPFQGELDLAIEGEQSKGQPIQAKRLSDFRQTGDCQILFISRSEQARFNEILAFLAGKPVLTVSDSEGFAQTAGGMVEFFTQNKKIRFYVALHKVKEAGLRMSGNLLRIAKVVDKAD